MYFLIEKSISRAVFLHCLIKPAFPSTWGGDFNWKSSARSIKVAHQLVLLTLDHKVTGLNPPRDRIHLITVQWHALHCTKRFIITSSSSSYDLNNVESDIKHQIMSSYG